jgi:hypothetical protein
MTALVHHRSRIAREPLILAPCTVCAAGICPDKHTAANPASHVVSPPSSTSQYIISSRPGPHPTSTRNSTENCCHHAPIAHFNSRIHSSSSPAWTCGTSSHNKRDSNRTSCQKRQQRDRVPRHSICSPHKRLLQIPSSGTFRVGGYI